MARPPQRMQANQVDAPPVSGIEALYRERYEPMVRVAYSLLGSRAEAEEVVQDAVVAVWRRWSDVDDPRAFLRTCVVNGARGRLRRRLIGSAVVVDSPPPGAVEALVELRDVLLRLPFRQRAAIVLRYLEDLGERDIAVALGCQPATVRSLVARGLAAIRSEVPR